MLKSSCACRFVLPSLTNVPVQLKQRERWHISTNLDVQVLICVPKSSLPCYLSELIPEWGFSSTVGCAGWLRDI